MGAVPRQGPDGTPVSHIGLVLNERGLDRAIEHWRRHFRGDARVQFAELVFDTYGALWVRTSNGLYMQWAGS